MWKFKKIINKKDDLEKSQTLGGFTKELVIALLMALVVIQYVIQAFKIPTGSMEDSLLINDFLLGIKFIYGAPAIPFSYMKLPGLTEPKKDDVVIFKYPGNDNKDYIKRCVATSGDTVEIKQKKLYINNKPVDIPEHGKHMSPDTIDRSIDPRDNFGPVCVPSKGDWINLDTTNIRDFYFNRILVHQENPRAKLRTDIQLYIDDVYSSQNYQFYYYNRQVKFSDINFDMIEWSTVQNIYNKIKHDNAGKNIKLKMFLYLNGEKVDKYELNYNCYFMMGDNRDNSADSRYWGFLSKHFVKAKALILYFSYKKTFIHAILNPIGEIRWNRIGKLIK